MQRWELIICFTSHSWTTDYVEASEHEEEVDIHEAYVEQYVKQMTGTCPDIAYIGTYHVEDIDDEDNPDE